MMVTPAMRRASRAMLAVALVAIVAALPRVSQAAHSPFALVRTTLETGWVNDKLGATFDHALSNATTVTLTDRTNTAVPGSTVLKGSVTDLVPDSVVFTPTVSLSENMCGGSGCTITFNAVEEEDGSTLTVTRTFKVDKLKPKAPAVNGLDLLVTGGIPSITGAGSDDVAATDTIAAFRSGVQSVELQFFRLEPSGSPSVGGLPQVGPGGQVQFDPSKVNVTYSPTRHVFSAPATLAPCAADNPACVNAAAQIVHDKAFSFTPTSLQAGLWTVKAIVIDKAGNRSNSAEVTFLYVG